jgi:hypothetical protein
VNTCTEKNKNLQISSKFAIMVELLSENGALFLIFGWVLSRFAVCLQSDKTLSGACFKVPARPLEKQACARIGSKSNPQG